ncbi:efflux RND transporter periplasmic adaptor subunit [Pseudohaliea rubra]|uniref:Putative Co/Zn/Cd efflux system membrane fusion protein n=1 Tax=Pseudohaliea rubra DSM 19751 TaxID=1265313 RepID=A0A095XV38_9GAMM|nr:efflux RND transporter periplasmic adaptor subunit [Pseudohaliea rubra]KGE03551.1 putative Co/Zn/Cd efflux system membrane fusion protein [Pseudohaliea rubra DSM 19751]
MLFVPRAPLVLLAATLALSACGQRKEGAPAEPAVRPVRTNVVAEGAGSELRRFPGRVEATQQAELSFRVAGLLRDIPVREGDRVETGVLLARLDPTDFETTLADRQATFDNAERNFRRASELVESGSISRLDYDRMEAQFRSAEAALKQARNNLAYTELRAPFAGRVAQRLVENFEEVQAKQPVLYLQGSRQLDVVIDLPEGIIRTVRRETAVNAEEDVRSSDAARVRAWASFDDHPALRLPLTLREVATRADPAAQTYRVTFSMEPPAEFTVLPGMSAEVAVDFSPLYGGDQAFWVPASAVQADAELEPRVWLYDPATGTVSGRPVSVGRLAEDRIEVLAGLAGGEEIITAGAPYLAEGMRVKPLPQLEQAEPRPGDR